MGRSAMEIEVRERLPSMLRRRTWLQGCAAAVAAAAVPVFAQKEDAPGLQPWRPVRMPALDATELQTGQRRTLADFAGHALVVNFWATWCPPCRREMPVLAQAQQAHPQVQFVFANQGETRDEVADYLRAENMQLGNVLLDSESRVMQQTGARALPTTLFFGADGRLRNVHMGELSRATLEARLREMQ